MSSSGEGFLRCGVLSRRGGGWRLDGRKISEVVVCTDKIHISGHGTTIKHLLKCRSTAVSSICERIPNP